MKSLRIALVMVEPPLPFGNAAARWFYVLLRGLVERGHQVTAFATCSNPADISKAAALFPPPKYNLRCYPHPSRRGPWAKWQTFCRPYSYMFSDELRRDLNEAMRSGIDILHLEQLWSGWVGLNHRERALPNTHYLFSIDQAASRPGTGFRARIINHITRRAEARLIRAFPRQLALTDRLAHAIKAVNPRAQVAVVPLGIDLTLYPFNANPPRDPGTPPTVGLIGSFNWTPSLQAGKRLIERLWPPIRSRFPAARLLIVGRCADAAFATYRGRVPGLEIRSDVPDPIPHFREIDVMVYAPDAGSGIKVKIVEAMALGVPVVTNTDGAEGLDVKHGVEAIVVEQDEGLIAGAVQLLEDAEHRSAFRQAARTAIQKRCAPQAVLDRLEEEYAGIVPTRSTSPSIADEPGATVVVTR